MNLAVSFMTAQLKKMCRLLPGVLVADVVTCVLVGSLFVFYMENSAYAADRKHFKIALVGNLEESYMGFGIQAVRMLDDSKYVVDFVAMTEQEARTAFLKNQVAAVIVIPDDLVDSLVHGRNDVKAECIVSKGTGGLADNLMEIYSEIASTLILHSQTGIFAMRDVLAGRQAWDILDSATDELNRKYLMLAIERTSLCDVELIGASNGLSAGGCLVCGVVIFMILLLGIPYSPMASSRENGLAKVFQSKGVPAAVQVLGEYAAYSLLVLICVAGIGAVFWGGLKTGLLPETEVFAPELHMASLPMASAVGVLVPVVLLFTAIQYFCHEMVPGVISSVPVRFIVGTAMCYVSGCFYPAGFFPDAVRRFGELLPTGMAMKYLAACIQGESFAKPVLGFAFYFTVCLSASCAVRNYRIRRG